MMVRHKGSYETPHEGEGIDRTFSSRRRLAPGASLAGRAWRIVLPHAPKQEPERSAGLTDRRGQEIALSCRAFDVAEHRWACAVTGTPEQEHAQPAVSLAHLGIADIVA
jgi:hypothetical protein